MISNMTVGSRADVVRDLQACGFETVEANSTGDVASLVRA